MQPIYVSMFGGKNKPQVTSSHTGTWKEFLKLFHSPLPCTIAKDDLELWSPTRYENEYRDDRFVQSVYALAFDVDENPIPSGLDLQRHLTGMQAVVSTSSSARAGAPRWRVVFALSRPVNREEYPQLWSAVSSRLPFPVGTQSKNPSRAWFVPREGEDGYYECFETEGEVLDVDHWLSLAPATPTKERPRLELVPPPNAERESKLGTAALILGTNWPAKGNGRHTAQRALSGALYRDRWSKESALEFLCAVCRHAGDENRGKRAQTIRDTWSTGESGGNLEGWTALGAHVDPAILQAARDLLKRDDFAKVAAELGKSKVEAPPAPTPKPEEKALCFEYGAWENEPPPVEFLVEGLVPRGCVAMWYGRADSLKTWLLYSLAIAIARGQPWLGKYPCKQVKVGIVDYETGKGNVRRRLYMLRAGNIQNLGTVAYPGMKPNQPEFWGELAKEGFDIVFIDSLRRSNSGADENDSAEAIIPLELASEFSESTGCSVHYIHHAKKSTSDGWPEFRGSAAIEDQVDCSFAVRKLDTGAASKKSVDVRCVKPGDMRTPDPFTAEVEFNDSARTANIRMGQVEAPTKGAEVTDARIQAEIRLALGNGATVKADIKKRVQGERSRVYAEIDAMCQRGQIVKTAEGYMLDGPEDREERVLVQVREYDAWKSAAALAKASYVTTRVVEEMIRDGSICKRGEGLAGFLEVNRDE